MAKINYKLLRERINWLDDYAAGLTRAQVVEKYSSEGVTAGSLRTVIDAAIATGLISGSYSSTGGGVTMDLEVREELMANKEPDVTVRLSKVPVSESAVKPLSGSTSPVIELLPMELEVLRDIAQERLQRRESKSLRSGAPQDTPTSVRLDAGLWDGLLAYADREGIKRSEAMNRAIEALLLGSGQLLK
jgi:hypothetical protein